MHKNIVTVLSSHEHSATPCKRGNVSRPRHEKAEDRASAFGMHHLRHGNREALAVPYHLYTERQHHVVARVGERREGVVVARYVTCVLEQVLLD